MNENPKWTYDEEYHEKRIYSQITRMHSMERNLIFTLDKEDRFALRKHIYDRLQALESFKGMNSKELLKNLKKWL